MYWSLPSPLTKCCEVMTIHHFQINEPKAFLKQAKNKSTQELKQNPDVFRKDCTEASKFKEWHI